MLNLLIGETVSNFIWWSKKNKTILIRKAKTSIKRNSCAR
jgi:membrane-bound inhibitor of C-type lysozyme